MEGLICNNDATKTKAETCSSNARHVKCPHVTLLVSICELKIEFTTTSIYEWMRLRGSAFTSVHASQRAKIMSPVDIHRSHQWERPPVQKSPRWWKRGDKRGGRRRKRKTEGKKEKKSCQIEQIIGKVNLDDRGEERRLTEIRIGP